MNSGPLRRRLGSVAARVSVAAVAAVACLVGPAHLAASASAVPRHAAAPAGGSVRPAAATGGPGGFVVLDGMDPLCHDELGASTGTYVTTVLGSLVGRATNTNDGSIEVLGTAAADVDSCGSQTYGDQVRRLVGSLTPVPAVGFAADGAALDAFFQQVADHTADPAVLYVPDSWTRSPDVDAALTAHAADIASFVHGGGALFSNENGYGWLTSLLPQAVYTVASCPGDGPYMTDAGTAAFPALTDDIVGSCWQGYFTGDVGSLTTLVDSETPSGYGNTDAGDGLVSVAVGGTLLPRPGSLTLAGPSGPTRAGDAALVTATVRDGSGSPASGVVVGFSVTAGPGTGGTGTATTDGDGRATFALTGSAGTDTVTARATEDDAAVTSTADVTFQDVPAAPLLAVTAGDGTLTVTATPGATDPDADPTDIAVRVDPDGLTQTLSAAGGTATFTGLTDGTPYTVSAVTDSAVGASAVATAGGTPHPPATAPSAPNLTAPVRGDGRLSVTVTPPSSDGGAPVTSVTVTAEPGGATAAVPGPGGGTATVVGLRNGQQYSLTAVATNSVGDSSPSEPLTATPATVPAAPSLSGAVAGDGRATVSVAAPADDGGAPVTSCTVTAEPGGARVVVAGAGGGTATVTGLADGTTYTFTAVATNDVGSSAPSAAVSATPVSADPVAAEYAALGGARSLLGAPVGAPFDVAGGRGELFTRGAIYWSPSTGAHEVHGLILRHDLALGGPAGWLRFPTGDEAAVGDGVGRVSPFSGGFGAAVFWAPDTGAWSVHGAILSRYLLAGGPRGVLGYPVADEAPTPDRVGRTSRFAHGLVLWSPASGAHEVHGAILARYASLGLTAGRLGYPTGDEYGVPGGRRSDFAGGDVVYVFATRATVVTYTR